MRRRVPGLQTSACSQKSVFFFRTLCAPHVVLLSYILPSMTLAPLPLSLDLAIFYRYFAAIGMYNCRVKNLELFFPLCCSEL